MTAQAVAELSLAIVTLQMTPPRNSWSPPRWPGHEPAGVLQRLTPKVGRSAVPGGEPLWMIVEEVVDESVSVGRIVKWCA
jgi:hypothetical protein